ncbi:hypothetical protein MMC13_004278 [Lambiella insularis]|nr:hypothetical protein [Lambiella insularis]
MLWRHGLSAASHRRLLSSACIQWSSLPVLRTADVSSFRDLAFVPGLPTLLPRKSLTAFPAAEKWFRPHRTRPDQLDLNYDYLELSGSSLVPLEYSSPLRAFIRSHAPLSLFLEWMKHADAATDNRFYLAQASLHDLPKALQDDFPAPAIVTTAGRGDVYATNLWIGLPPTYTPLHRDPNPNLFVQLAGSKRVRLLGPEVGQSLFDRVQSLLKTGSSGKFRGDEMMQGREKELLEEEVWASKSSQRKKDFGYEAQIEAGDALFIPNGWWHSIKGTGEGVTASVNWWFR